MYVALGAMAAFAFVTNGLLRFDEWRLRRRVADKLSLSSIICGRNIRGAGIFFGVSLNNSAQFAVEFEVKRLSTRIGNLVPLETKFDVKRVTIPPNGSGFFNDHVIAIDNPSKPGTLQGFIEYEFAYGQSGPLKYSLSGKKQVIVSFNNEGLLVHGSWNDAA